MNKYAVPAAQSVKIKENEKRDKYLDLARELKKLRRKVLVIPSKDTEGIRELRPSRPQY